MKAIIRAVPERMGIVRSFTGQIAPIKTIISCDHQRQGAMKNFYMALSLAGEDSAIHMEDDVELTSDFSGKIIRAINRRPNDVIQFFSMRQADIDFGSRYDSNFIGGLCFYLPKGMSRAILEYKWPGIEKHPSGLDLMVNDFLKENKIKYYIHVPNLVDHLPIKSAIDPRRGSTNRVSKTFVK